MDEPCEHRLDDSAEYRCKDCGVKLTWVGPNDNDWVPVDLDDIEEN